MPEGLTTSQVAEFLELLNAAIADVAEGKMAGCSWGGDLLEFYCSAEHKVPTLSFARSMPAAQHAAYTGAGLVENEEELKNNVFFLGGPWVPLPIECDRFAIGDTWASRDIVTVTLSSGGPGNTLTRTRNSLMTYSSVLEGALRRSVSVLILRAHLRVWHWRPSKQHRRRLAGPARFSGVITLRTQQVTSRIADLGSSRMPLGRAEFRSHTPIPRPSALSWRQWTVDQVPHPTGQ